MLATRKSSTISSLNMAYLRESNALSPPKPNGFRSLSVSSYLSTESSSLDDSIEIPDDLDSVAAMQFCGFTFSAATDVFERYSRSEFRADHFLIEFAVGYITGRAYLRNAVDESDDWDTALTEMGMTRDKIDALLKPEHKPFRMMQTAEQWAKEIVSDTFHWLEELDDIITCGKGRGESVRPYSPGPDVKPSAAIVRPSSGSAKPRSSAAGKSSQPVIETSVVLPGALDGHTMIYKGGITTRLEQIWPDKSSNSLAFQRFRSTPPTDFSPDNPRILYFTKQKQCAEHYANLKQDINKPVPICILHVAVPNEIIGAPMPVFGEDWYNLVWASRGINDWGEIPADLVHYTQARLLVGEVCGTSTEVIKRLSRARQLRPLMLKNGGAKASQYAFQGNAVFRELNKHCVGKVWLEDLSARGVARHRK